MKIIIADGEKGEAMSDSIQIYFDEDGKAKAYDDTYDIVIHCGFHVDSKTRYCPECGRRATNYE